MLILVSLTHGHMNILACKHKVSAKRERVPWGMQSIQCARVSVGFI